MSRTCAGCRTHLDSDEFSMNQWRKGEGNSRCQICVSGLYREPSMYRCSDCGRDFGNSNQLKMHEQVHRPRVVSCPVCGDKRFKTGANAVQHVEAGNCKGCLGRDNARHKIYEFATQQPSMHRYLTSVPMIGYGEYTSEVPEYPYKCDYCDKRFKNLSQQMQHQDQKHEIRNNFRIGY